MAIELKGMKDAYKFYRIKEKINNPIEIPVYRKIISGFMKFLVAKLLDGYDIQLGEGNGFVFGVRGKKLTPFVDEEGNVKGALVDWGASRKIWTKKAQALGITMKEYIDNYDDKPLIFHLNEHTNGVSYKIKWIRYGMPAVFANSDCYSFKTAKNLKRFLLPKRIRDGQEYIIESKNTNTNVRN